MTQAKTDLIAIRPAAPPAATIYFPEIYTPKHGTYFPELGTGDTTKATIVADLASNQRDNIVRVLAIDLASGRGWDASVEIADLVLDVVLAENEGIPAWCEDFLETHLGINRVREAEYEYRHAA